MEPRWSQTLKSFQKRREFSKRQFESSRLKRTTGEPEFVIGVYCTVLIFSHVTDCILPGNSSGKELGGGGGLSGEDQYLHLTPLCISWVPASAWAPPAVLASHQFPAPWSTDIPSCPEGMQERALFIFLVCQNELLIKTKAFKQSKYYKSIEMVRSPEYNWLIIFC